MKADIKWSSGIESDVQFGYLDPAVPGPRRYNPRVVLNAEDTSVLRTLREELRHCSSFLFSVAFVTPSAIALLKQELVDFGGVGRIVTSDYLGFNAPDAFAELLNLGQLGIEVRVHPSAAFHPKGYIFDRAGSVTAMVGSSNLTFNALVSNHEWNLKVSATSESDLGEQLSRLVARQLVESEPLTAEWIANYAAAYVPPAPRARRVPPGPARPVAIVPNKMQEVALASIAHVRNAGHDRAVVISATGTGKTILAALDVRTVGPKRMLFIVHREQILDRAIEEFRQVLGGEASDFGKIAGSTREMDRRYVFAMAQTLAQPGVVNTIDPSAFEYVIVDEAHRAGSPTHRRLIDHFKPNFLLGMTATPERMDGFNVFELFNFNVPYEIRLNHALEEDMLAPFHYYGVADVSYADGRAVDDEADLRVLISADRVDHLVKALEIYGQAAVSPRGLIFCSRRDEARDLSDALNRRLLRGSPLRTVALTGEDSPEVRSARVAQLERGELDYILTVDIFNEGVDIPTVNQVVMLRQTQSAIVFVQQLGRGLRKASGKDYLVVIDFIGNYSNNFLIPIALFGDESLNKESLRQHLIAAEEAGVLPGLSSVRFDRIARARVLKSITDTKLDSLQNLKKSIDILRNRLGHLPALTDFVRFESVDPVVVATRDKNYPELLSRLFRGHETHLTAAQSSYLQLLSHEVLTAKRPHERAVVELVLGRGPTAVAEIGEALNAAGIASTDRQVRSAVDTLTLSGHAGADVTRYNGAVASCVGDVVDLNPDLRASYLANPAFAVAVDDLLETSREVVALRYDSGRPFTPGRQYSRKEATRLLTMPRKWTSTLYGYKVDRDSGTCPIFVTLHKSGEIAVSTAYEDTLIDRQTMLWYTRSRRSLTSDEVRPIVENQVDLHVFVKKDDAEGSDFYYLGQAIASHAEQTTMSGAGGATLDVVRMLLRFEEPIDSALFDYFHPEITN